MQFQTHVHTVACAIALVSWVFRAPEVQPLPLWLYAAAVCKAVRQSEGTPCILMGLQSRWSELDTLWLEARGGQEDAHERGRSVGAHACTRS